MIAGASTVGAAISGCSGADTVRGVSISAEYSRTSRPWPQSTSTRKVSSGSLTGWVAGDADHRIAAGVQRLGELQVGDEADRRSQADAGEGLRRGERRLELFQFGRIAGNDRDFGQQRLADLRFHLDLPESQRGRAEAGEDRQ